MIFRGSNMPEPRKDIVARPVLKHEVTEGDPLSRHKNLTSTAEHGIIGYLVHLPKAHYQFKGD